MAGGSGEEVRREMNRYKRGRTKSGLGGGVVNLKTANGLGIEIPASILLRAEKVIEQRRYCFIPLTAIMLNFAYCSPILSAA
jgi:hypothetical protein